MRILAIETSCDDTAVAIVEDGCNILASRISSQIEHEKWGGVVPELAARLHNEQIILTIKECFKQVEFSWEKIDYIAVTQGPGLNPSLLIGTNAASFLALLLGKKVLPVHHIWGHFYANFLQREKDEIKFPALVLTISGGHTQIHLWNDFSNSKLLGKTLDDACGEAFDKVAKMLNLGYPGGPIVANLAEKGDRNRFKLPIILLDKKSLDFSFSGLKAAIYRLVTNFPGKISQQDKNDICASFQWTVVQTLERKVRRVLEENPAIRQIHFTGGVSANLAIREVLKELSEEFEIDFLFPKQKEFCTDNAAMIASAAFYLLNDGKITPCEDFVEANNRLEF